MKKILSITLLFLVFGGLSAQITDTMRYRDGRCPRYHYSCWYDTTPCYLFPVDHPYDILPLNPNFLPAAYNLSVAKREYAPDNLLVSGVAIMVTDSLMPVPRIVPGVTDTTVVPDTCFIFTHDSSAVTGTILSMARWDTASPKIWRLPMNRDTLNRNYYRYCYVYEVLFPTPVAIDSDSYFWVMGTQHNMEYTWIPSNNVYLHPPRPFVAIGNLSYDVCSDSYLDSDIIQSFRSLTDSTQNTIVDLDTILYIYPYQPGRTIGGPYLPIWAVPDTVVLSTSSANPAVGYTTPTMRRVPKGFLQTIQAHSYPGSGYVFTHWNDGSRENPRRVRIMDTAHFVAYFSLGKFEVTTEAVGTGRVEGGGSYNGGDTVEVRAIPQGFSVFRHWQDGDSTNPRRFVVTSDTTFRAYFTLGPYTITADAPDGGGTVEGGGVYGFMDTVILTATPFENYTFSHWQSGDTANPYTIIVYWNGEYHAYFTCDTCDSDTSGTDTTGTDTIGIAPVTKPALLFTLTPNPTTGKVTITVAHPAPKCELTLRDAAGHEVMRKEFSIVNSQFSIPLALPAGAYFVTLTTPTASSTQRLVVK